MGGGGEGGGGEGGGGDGGGIDGGVLCTTMYTFEKNSTCETDCDCSARLCLAPSSSRLRSAPVLFSASRQSR